MFLSFLRRLLRSRDPIEITVRISARILAKTLYFFYKHYKLGHFKDPKIAVLTTTLVVASKNVKSIAKGIPIVTKYEGGGFLGILIITN